MDPKAKLVLLFLSASLTMGLVSQVIKNGDPQANKRPFKKQNPETHSGHEKPLPVFGGRG